MAIVSTLSASRLILGVSPAFAMLSKSDSCTEQALLSATQTDTRPGSTRRRTGPDRSKGNATTFSPMFFLVSELA